MTEQQSFDNLFKSIIPIASYRGVIVSKTKEGYKIFQNNSVIAKNKEEVDAVIEKALNSLSKSITND